MGIEAYIIHFGYLIILEGTFFAGEAIPAPAGLAVWLLHFRAEQKKKSET